MESKTIKQNKTKTNAQMGMQGRKQLKQNNRKQTEIR